MELMRKNHVFKNKELWRKNLSASLKGRKVWNKGKEGLQVAWNKIYLPEKEIINLYKINNIFSTDIAKKYNVSRYVILRILKENGIKLKKYSDFIRTKTIEELYGKEKADKIKKKISIKSKIRKVTWGDKISKSLKKYYRECKLKNYKIHRKSKPLSSEHRLKLSMAHKKYLKEHPEELDRLRKIQYPGNVTKIEQKMLNFLKKEFIKGKDFHFDKRDVTGKTFYRPDFQFPKQKIIIELDGYYKHYTKEGYIKDKVREHYLKKAGWKVYRFSFYDIDRNYKFEKVKNKVMDIFGIGNVNIRN